MRRHCRQRMPRLPRLAPRRSSLQQRRLRKVPTNNPNPPHVPCYIPGITCCICMVSKLLDSSRCGGHAVPGRHAEAQHRCGVVCKGQTGVPLAQLLCWNCKAGGALCSRQRPAPSSERLRQSIPHKRTLIAELKRHSMRARAKMAMGVSVLRKRPCLRLLKASGMRADESEDKGDYESSEEAPLVQCKRAPLKKPAVLPAARRPVPKGKKVCSHAECPGPRVHAAVNTVHLQHLP